MRRDSLATRNDRLWPDGRIPYEIDDSIKGEALEDLTAAIEEWNSKTVISLFPRTDEREYAYFANRGCSSGLGRGAPTKVNAVCGYFGGLHEIGHLVGLLHEDQRWDRDNAIAIRPGYWLPKYGRGRGPVSGPYDH